MSSSGILRMLPLMLICFSSCFVAERDNDNDPHSSGYSVKGYISSATGTIMAGHEPITIRFDDQMDSDNVNFAGSDLIDGNYIISWSSENFDNDVLTISMNPARKKAFLSEGQGKRIVVNSHASITFDVENRIYVRTIADGGSDGNLGTANQPVSTIRKGIELAKSIYNGADAKVFVAEGTYTNSGDDSKPVFEAAEGISVYGGYSNSSWNKREVSQDGSVFTYETIIENVCTTLDPAIMERSCTIRISSEAAVTRKTVLEGMTIKPGRGRTPDSNGTYNHTAIFCDGSPVIRYNYFPGRNAGEDPGNEMSGIYCTSGSPLIINNTINAGANAGVNEDVALADFSNYWMPDASYAIYLLNASARVEGNIIDGGSGVFTCGVYCCGECAPEIIGNASIDGGKGSDAIVPGSGSFSIYVLTARPTIERNVIWNQSSNVDWYGIYEDPAAPDSDPLSVLNNTFKNAIIGFLYFDEGTTSINNLTTPISNSQSGTLAAWGNTAP